LLFYQGLVAGFTSDFAQMKPFYQQSRELFEQIGDQNAIVDMFKDRGCMLVLEGKYREAIDYLFKSIESSYKLDHKPFMVIALGLLSFAFGMVEETEPAFALYSAQLGGNAHALAYTIGVEAWLTSSPLAQIMYQQIRSRIDEQTWEAAWNAGEVLTIEQVIALART
jgi:hypothetical protein